MGIEVVLPKDSPLREKMMVGDAYAPRPFAGRALLIASAMTQGRTNPLTEQDSIHKWRLDRGIPSRVNIPVFHWTGVDNGVEQEYGVLFSYYTKGDPLKAAEPAGTLGASDALA